MAVLQRLDSVAIIRRAIDRRLLANILAGGRRRNERQQCVGQLTHVLVLASALVAVAGCWR